MARVIAAGQIRTASLSFSPPAMLSDLPALIQEFPCRNEGAHLGEGLESIRSDADFMNVLLPASHPAAAQEIVDPALLGHEEYQTLKVGFVRGESPRLSAR